jgi:hypothetical protein
MNKYNATIVLYQLAIGITDHISGANNKKCITGIGMSATLGF